MDFGINDLEKMPSGDASQVNFFSLKNDGDSARVRFLYETAEDVRFYGVHKVTFASGKFRYTTCLRKHYEDPADMCPLCSSWNADDRKIVKKIWIPMYDVDNGEIVLWDRGVSFLRDKLYPIIQQKVNKQTPLCAYVFSIICHGLANSMDTDYEIVEESCDGTTIDDFDEVPSPVGTVILSKTYDELASFVQNRTFGQNSNAGQRGQQGQQRSYGNGGSDSEQVVRRRGTRPNTMV